MKPALLVLAFSAFFAGAAAAESKSNPLASVIGLLDDLAAKVKADMMAEAKAYKAYAEYCEKNAVNLEYEIETAITYEEKLSATITETSSTVEVTTSKIEVTISSIASSEAELKEATEVREKELADFKAEEKELMDTIDTLERAIAILSREMAKNPAALAQIDTTSMSSLLQSLSVMVDAASLSSKDQSKLIALVQAQQSESDGDDEELSSPAAAAYKSHSGSIVDLILDLKDKAESELAALRKTEMSALHSYEMMKQSLEVQITTYKKEMTTFKYTKTEATEEKATSTGELSVTSKDLAESKKSLELLKSDCATKAEDHDASVAGFAAELKTIAEAKKILQDTTSGAVDQTYSFVQLQSRSKLQTSADLANSEVVALVKKVAREQHSSALAQLASRIAAVMRYGTRNGQDPFAKVKGLISDLIEKLEKEAGEESEEKAFCDEEMKKTTAKKDELEDVISKLSVKIDKASAKSAQLKEDVKELQKELGELHSKFAEMQELRSTESADFKKAKSDLTLGLEGVRKALSVLRDYYESGSAAAFLQSQQPEAPPTYSKSTGAGGSIIDILEVCEADFAKDLAEKEAAESDAQSAFEKETQEMKVTQATKEQDVKYKTGEFTSLDKAIAEFAADKDSTDGELSAVLEYSDKLKERCVKEPESYESKKARREAEISGLKKALAILEGESLLQRGHARRMRGSRAAAMRLQ
mmetsp:Transcript_87407/g.160100  ORF Transcript_87407/g.160100 Transcript_87407/m.160100 type:complete len:705 (-) Transcript_87407:31-2145(-)